MTKSQVSALRTIDDKIRSGRVTKADLKLSPEETFERNQRLDNELGTITSHLKWNHATLRDTPFISIPYNDYDIIPRSETLLNHLRAQCKFELRENWTTVTSTTDPAFFSGSIGWVRDWEATSCVRGNYNSDAVINIHMSYKAYEMLLGIIKSDKTVASHVVTFPTYRDCDDNFVLMLHQGYYPNISADDIYHGVMINWNHPFWERFLNQRGVHVIISCNSLSKSGSTICYVTHNGSDWEPQGSSLEIATNISSGMRGYSSPEDCYAKSNLSRLQKSYKSSAEKYYVTPKEVLSQLNEVMGEVDDLVDDDEFFTDLNEPETFSALDEVDLDEEDDDMYETDDIDTDDLIDDEDDGDDEDVEELIAPAPAPEPKQKPSQEPKQKSPSKNRPNGVNAASGTSAGSILDALASGCDAVDGFNFVAAECDPDSMPAESKTVTTNPTVAKEPPKEKVSRPAAYLDGQKVSGNKQSQNRKKSKK